MKNKLREIIANELDSIILKDFIRKPWTKNNIQDVIYSNGKINIVFKKPLMK